jgi:hypothetical protein
VPNSGSPALYFTDFPYQPPGIGRGQVVNTVANFAQGGDQGPWTFVRGVPDAGFVELRTTNGHHVVAFVGNPVTAVVMTAGDDAPEARTRLTQLVKNIEWEGGWHA